MWTLYANHKNLRLDDEKAECLLESSINRHAPFFFWAKFLPSKRLHDFIRRIAIDGKYPAPNMVLKIAHAIGGTIGFELIDFVAKNCSYSSVKGVANSLKKTVENNNRLKKVYGTKVKIETRAIDIENMKRAALERLIDDTIKTKNKTEIKRIDALFYGPELEVKKK